MSRRLAVWIAILVIFFALVAASAGAGGGSARNVAAPLESDGVTYTATTLQSGSSDETIAVVPVTGTITNGDSSADGSSTGGDDILRMLDAIRASDRFDGVILKIDTPGGAVLASSEITAAIERLREEDVPVVAWMRDAAASGGYYISAPADRIVAAPSTFTGSIGVILEYYEISELAGEVGVRAITIKSGKLKDIGSPFRPITPEERAVLQSIIDEAYGDFVEVVADGRDMSEEEVRKIADGRIYTGRQAKELGLVDELGSTRTAYDAMSELLDRDDDDGEELDVVEFARSYSFVEALSAHAAPTLDAAAAARSAAELLRGRQAAPLRRAGNGLLSLEYRAQL